MEAQISVVNFQKCTSNEEKTDWIGTVDSTFDKGTRSVELTLPNQSYPISQ